MPDVLYVREGNSSCAVAEVNVVPNIDSFSDYDKTYQCDCKSSECITIEIIV